MKLFLATLAILATSVSTSCPKGWLERFGFCYFISKNVYHFDTAETLCVERKAHLVSFATVEERDFITEMAASRAEEYWIGGKRDNGNSPFRWVDGTTPGPADASISNWEDNEPSSNGNCIKLNHWSRKWMAAPCNWWKKYICKRSEDTIDPCDVDADWHHVGRSCYKYVHDKENWHDADDQCEAMGGWLVILNETRKLNIFQEIIDCNDLKSGTWIGLSDTESPRQLKWLNGQNLGQVTNWAAGQPVYNADVGDHCVSALESDMYKWVVDGCADDHNYVCEKPEGTCASGWEEHGQMCYQVIAGGSQSKTWTDARDYCESINGDLMMVRNQGHQDSLKRMLSNLNAGNVRSVYIGVWDGGDDGEWVYADDGQISFASWASGGATNQQDRADCVSVNTDDPQGQWRAGYCFVRKAFICEININQKPTPPRPPSVAYECENGWRVGGSRCYSFPDTPKTWDAARQDCQGQGAQLAKVDDVKAQTVLSGNSAGDTWYGLRYESGSWKWRDGSVMTFKNWGVNQQNDPSGKPCVAGTGDGSLVGEWRADACNAQKVFVCQKPGRQTGVSPPTPAPTLPWSPLCGPGWRYDPMGGSCYLVRMSGRTFDQALSDCRQNGADLASVVSPQDQNFITAMIHMTPSYGVYWIGGHDRDRGSGWQWTDGSPFIYFNWNRGEPNNYGGREPCIELATNNLGTWNDARCERRFRSICKKPAQGFSTPRPTDEPAPQCSGANAMVSGQHYIQDSHLSASSSASGRGPEKARLNGPGYWRPATENNNQYIQADFSYPIVVRRVRTKGRSGVGWVTKFFLLYRYDASSNFMYVKDNNGQNKEFVANGNSWQTSTSTLDRPIEARFVRLSVSGWDTAIAMQFEIDGCKTEDCQHEALISGNVIVQDAQLSASSSSDGNHGPANARLRDVGFSPPRNGWSPSSSSGGQYIQAELEVPMRIRGIATKGRSDGDYFVRTYKFAYKESATDASFKTYEQPRGTEKIFDGNRNNNDEVFNELVSPIEAAVVRIIPLTWNGQIGLRFDVHGCAKECGPQPMISGRKYRVPDAQLTASSSYDDRHGPHRSRLNRRAYGGMSGAWSSRQVNQNQYIQVDFRALLRVYAIATQGRQNRDQWVLTYRVLYSSDTQTWVPYMEGGNPKDFRGNWNRNTVNKHYVSEPFNARAVRVNARTWRDHISLRWEIWGCTGPWSSQYVGCYGDDELDRDLKESRWDNPAGGMTRQICARHCFHAGYLFGGVQQGNICFCGNSYGSYGTSTTCNTPCQGDPGTTCGGPNANDVITTGAGPGDERCRDGWTRGPKNQCFQFHRNRTRWHDALQYCRDNGGDLAIINSPEEQNFMEIHMGNLQRDAWFGLHRTRDNKVFEWTLHVPVRFTNWNYREPNNYVRTGEHCVMIYWQNGKWNDDPCTRIKGFICQAPPTSLPPPTDTPVDPGCGEGWLAYRWKCFQIVPASKNWQWHDGLCKSHGGQLARIEDRFEQAYLASLLGQAESQFYLDLSDQTTQGTFLYSNGRYPQYTHWGNNQPQRLNAASCATLGGKGNFGQWLNVLCTSTFPGICEKNSSTTTRPTAGPVTPPTGGCPTGWVVDGDYCYQINTKSKVGRTATWDEARASCEDEGATLASIHSDRENDFLFKNNLVGTNYQAWIGLRQRAGGNGYEWNDGTPTNYVNWNDGQPGTSDTVRCVDMSQTTGLWTSRACNQQRNWICKALRGSIAVRTTPAYPPSSGSCGPNNRWQSYGGRCYNITSGGLLLTWHDAQNRCQQDGASLVSIRSEDEQNFIQGQLAAGSLSYREPWIGLTKIMDGSWSWSDGSPTSYVNWAQGSPSASGIPGCGTMTPNGRLDVGKWKDDHCANLHPFICVINPGASPPTNPPPVLPGNCPQGWKDFRNKCFKIFGDQSSDRVNWETARSRCSALASPNDLASVSNSAEQAALTAMMAGRGYNVWLGMRRYRGEWRWTDNSPTTYTNWARGEPNGGTREPCVLMWAIAHKAGMWNDARCEANAGYACMMLKQPNLPVPVPPPGRTCPSGYSAWNSQCYRLINSPVSWQAAQAQCRSAQANLVSIHSRQENAFVFSEILRQRVQSRTWIGFSDSDVPGHFRWVDKWTITYTNWGTGQPARPQGGCVSLDGQQDGRWFDESCSEQRPAVCKWTDASPIITPPPPGEGSCPDTNPSDHWIYDNGNCYLFKNNALKTFSQARLECNQRDSDLASVHSQEENDFIFHHVTSTARGRQWIGLVRMQRTGFTWLDGSPVQYTNWDKNEPNNANNNEDCTELNQFHGRWNDMRCTFRSGYVCKVKALTAGPTNPPPTGTRTGTGGGPASPGKTQPISFFPPRSTTPPDLNKSPVSAQNAGQIAGGVIGVLLAVAIVIGVVVFLRKRGLPKLKSSLPDEGFQNPSYSSSTGVQFRNDEAEA